MIITTEELPNLNLSGKIVGLTSGCYDLVHFYHLHYLERCKAHCDFLIVGVDSNELLTKFKQKQATIPEHHRAAMISALRCVDASFVLRDLSQFSFAAKFSTKIFKNKAELYGKPIVGIEHAELVVIPDIEELTSTTEIVKKIRKN